MVIYGVCDDDDGGSPLFYGGLYGDRLLGWAVRWAWAQAAAKIAPMKVWQKDPLSQESLQYYGRLPVFAHLLELQRCWA